MASCSKKDLPQTSDAGNSSTPVKNLRLYDGGFADCNPIIVVTDGSSNAAGRLKTADTGKICIWLTRGRDAVILSPSFRE